MGPCNGKKRNKLTKEQSDLIDFVFHTAPECVVCGGLMFRHPDPNNKIYDLLVCSSCGYEESELTYVPPGYDD